MHHFEAMKSSNVHFTFFRMGKILEGLLAGSVEAEVPHGVECLRDAKHIWERFGGVIDQLKHGSFNSVLHAIEDMGHVIHDIANELEECKATVGTDLDKLREMSKAFTDPWYFIFHVEHDLIVNGQDVHHEIMDAEAQWENQHFYEFGHSVGLALSKIFLGGQMKNDIPADYLVASHHTPVHHTPLIHEPVLTHHETVAVPVVTTHHESIIPYHEPVHTTHHANEGEKANWGAGHDGSYGHPHGGYRHDDYRTGEHALRDHEALSERVHEDHHYDTGHTAEFYGDRSAHREDFHVAQGEKSPDYYTHEYKYRTAHEDPAHFIESLQDHHGYHHDEPHVVHDHPIHHEVPTHHFPHTVRTQEEPHVEFEHEAHSGPLDHEYTTVVPEHHDFHPHQDLGEVMARHGHDAYGYDHSFTHGHGLGYEHATDYHHYAADSPHHYYTEAAHHYYQ